MKPFLSLLIFLALSAAGFAQSAISKISEVTKVMMPDSSKSKSKSSMQTNLAVSDEGSSGAKSTQNKAEVSGKGKSEGASRGTGRSGGGNLAVSDEGSSGKKGGKPSSLRTAKSDSAKNGQVPGPKQP